MTTSIKTCFKCGETKILAAFYKHKQMADGHLNNCKECFKSAVRENRRKRVDYYRECDRKRAMRPDRVAARDEYRKTEAGKAAAIESKRRFVLANPIKRAAHVSVGNAVRDGKMVRKSCEVCGAGRTHAHHDDYTKPLEVRWLCPAHHRQWHVAHGEAKTGEET